MNWRGARPGATSRRRGAATAASRTAASPTEVVTQSSAHPGLALPPARTRDQRARLAVHADLAGRGHLAVAEERHPSGAALRRREGPLFPTGSDSRS